MASASTRRIYGWKPSLPSSSDNFLSIASRTISAKFPRSKILEDKTKIYDQGQLGSCTANALAGCFEFSQIKQNQPTFMPSRLFIYYNERVLENTVNYDSGAMLDDGIKTMIKDGVCPETTWPYNISEFRTKPSELSFKQASDHQVIASRKMPTSINGFKTAINMGYPVAFGFSVYEYMETSEMATEGLLKMPEKGQKSIGGHAVVCIGYSDNKRANGNRGFLKIRNSWGPEWGLQGYFWMPYAYVKAGLCSDLVIITQNEESMINENNKLIGK